MPPGRRMRGRPRVAWLKGIYDAVEKRGVEEGQWIDREL
jgi:hypothetical protein